ncbi:DUF2642 domain-containing protein [Solibacillus sp. FSL W7-1324]|uniref:DUF2642 domain-containing protein n=1 Tax=Solibacillus sp. FSL W7-1324 TaxID=2921701 RepID=UPI0030F76921
MWQLRRTLETLKGSSLTVATEYAKVTGTLLEVNFDYITLSSNSDFLYIPLTSIKNIAY